MTVSLFTKSEEQNQEDHIKTTISINPEEYMKDRVVHKINTYQKLATRSRIFYRILSTVGIVVSSLVTIQINFTASKLWPTIFSVLVTATVSVEKLFRFREHWANYDEMTAFLRSEQLKYQTRSGEYSDKHNQTDGEQKAFERFVSRIERAILDERKETIEMRTSDVKPV